MMLQLLDPVFCVCKVADFSQVDWTAEFIFIAKTDDECSLVCPDTEIPPNQMAIEPDWRAIKIVGTLDFSLVGIIAKLSAILAAHQISLFVVSTFNTDYVLVKQTKLAQTLEILEAEGYQFTESTNNH